MKKIVALLLALVMGLSLVSTAFAAETYDNDNTAVQVTTTENGRTYEKVRMAITRDGHVAAVKTLKSAYSTLKPFDKEEIEKISYLKNGGIIRGKGLIKGNLDERNMLAEGSTIATLSLEVVNLEELTKALGDGVAINAVTVMDAASIYHNGHIGHRAIDRPTNLVARFHQPSGASINVFYDTFDGQRKLVFDAEAISVSNGGNGGTTTNPGTGTDFTIGGENQNDNTDFTISGSSSSGSNTGSASNGGSNGGSTDTSNGGGTTTNNESSHSGWSTKLTGGSTGSSSSSSESSNSQSSGENTGFTI